MDIKQQIQQKIDARTQADRQDIERRSIINRGICPDCAGDMTKTSSMFGEVFLYRTKFKCKDCGRLHVLQSCSD